MTSKHSVVIAEPVRTAIGTFGGTLKDIPAVELGATAIGAALQPRINLSTPENYGKPLADSGSQDRRRKNNRRKCELVHRRRELAALVFEHSLIHTCRSPGQKPGFLHFNPPRHPVGRSPPGVG
jgi:hypothetical protein